MHLLRNFLEIRDCDGFSFARAHRPSNGSLYSTVDEVANIRSRELVQLGRNLGIVNVANWLVTKMELQYFLSGSLVG